MELFARPSRRIVFGWPATGQRAELLQRVSSARLLRRSRYVAGPPETRCALRAAAMAARAGLRADGHADAGAGNWGNDGNLYARRCGVAAASSGAQRGTAVSRRRQCLWRRDERPAEQLRNFFLRPVSILPSKHSRI